MTEANTAVDLDDGNQSATTVEPDCPERVGPDVSAKLGDIAAAAGLRRIEMVAWRDLDHPEAGGSEIHAARIAERWAAAGIEVIMTASRAPAADRESSREGYRVRRPAGRYGIFPAAGAARACGREPAPDATVEIWNGMPFFSPLWARGPRVVFLHHVHGGMWDLILPRPLAAVGRFIEKRLAPPLYRDSQIVTLSPSSRRCIIDQLGFQPSNVSVVRPGVDDSFSPGPGRSDHPLVAAVGRLVPYKRFDQLIEVLVRLRRRHPDLEAVIAGEGNDRALLEELVRQRGAAGWIRLPGHIDDQSLVELYRRAWVVASTSAYEGWGLTISEAAACGTPAVVSPIAGHCDAVDDGVTGYLAEPGREMELCLDRLLNDSLLRRRMQKAARQRAALLTWDRTALDILRLLARQAGPAASTAQPLPAL